MEAVEQQFTNLWTGPDQTDHYPPLSPPVGRKSDVFDEKQFMDIDRHAAQAPETLRLNFAELMNYLTKGLTSDLQKLRSLFTWMGKQELLDASKYLEDPLANTPGRFLKDIASSEGGKHHDIACFFALLCRLADLPCIVLKGYNKRTVSYEVGENPKEEHVSSWNAVHVDGSWRLLHPVMAFTGVIAKEAPDWVLVEDSGQALRESFCEEEQMKAVQHIEEWYFLPDPDKFIYFCYPKQSDCQLLPEPWTLEKFVKTPLVTSFYLRSHWHLADTLESVVLAPSGKCCIQMDRVPEGEAIIRYKLLFNKRKSRGKFPEKLQLENYVIRNGTTKQQSVVTRLPVNGIYKLKIMDAGKSELCEVRIKCTGEILDQHRFPETSDKGFGFSQEAIDAGLVDPSREEGVLMAQEGEKVRFRFRTVKPLAIRARLLHSALPSQQLDDRIDTEQEEDVVTITVRVPWHEQNPEFSLQVDAKETNSEDQYVNVLNYLLTPDRQLVCTIKDPQQQLREELAAAINDNDVYRLEKAVQEFRRGHLKDDDLLDKAYTRLCHLHRASVEGARNNEEKLATALQDADVSQVAYMLRHSAWLQQAQDALRRMRRLAGVKHEVQSLSKKQVSEIQSYNRPHAGVRAAVVATYILLGEKPRKLQNWSYVQSLLRRHGKENIMQRLQNLDTSAIDKERIKQAALQLNTCSAEEIRCVSIGAASFYNWSKAVVESADEDANVSGIKHGEINNLVPEETPDDREKNKREEDREGRDGERTRTEKDRRRQR